MVMGKEFLPYKRLWTQWQNQLCELILAETIASTTLSNRLFVLSSPIQSEASCGSDKSFYLFFPFDFGSQISS